MVKLAPSLPKENERNGLEARTLDLIANYSTGATVPVVMVVRTLEVTQNKDYETVPKIEVVHIEAVPEERAEEVRRLLGELHDARVRHRKEPLDFGADEAEGDFGQAVRAIEAGDAGDVVDAEVVDEPTITEKED